MGNTCNCFENDQQKVENLEPKIFENKHSNPQKRGEDEDYTDTSLEWSKTETTYDHSKGEKIGISFKSMTKQDYLSLYDGIHTLLTERKIGRDQENELYELIGKQDQRLAVAYFQFKSSGNPEALTAPLKSMKNLKL